MRRWLMVLLLLVVPLQLVWAAAAPYCGHESPPATKKHFGHHEHRHQADDAASSGDDGADPVGTAHVDCETCHLSATVSLPAPALVIALPSTAAWCGPPRAHYLSHIPRGPERPDRTELAAAVRSAGGVESGLPLPA